MPNRSRKPPTDPNEAAASILAQVTGEVPKIEPPPKNAAAVALGRLGGEKGGRARAKALTPEQRAESARKAAAARWGSGAAENDAITEKPRPKPGARNGILGSLRRGFSRVTVSLHLLSE